MLTRDLFAAANLLVLLMAPSGLGCAEVLFTHSR